MDVLTIHQPFANRIISGKKTTENRSLSFPVKRGRYKWIAIHAAKSKKRPDHEPPYGLIIGVVYWEDDFEAGIRQIIFFTASKKLKTPIPWTGNLGLRKLPDDIVSQITAQLPRRIANEINNQS